MYQTLYIDLPGLDARSAHRQAIATLTHYGFECSGGATTKLSRNVARVRLVALHCANDHEGALRLAACAMPKGTRVGIDHNAPFQ